MAIGRREEDSPAWVLLENRKLRNRGSRKNSMVVLLLKKRACWVPWLLLGGFIGGMGRSRVWPGTGVTYYRGKGKSPHRDCLSSEKKGLERLICEPETKKRVRTEGGL